MVYVRSKAEIMKKDNTVKSKTAPIVIFLTILTEIEVRIAEGFSQRESEEWSIVVCRNCWGSNYGSVSILMLGNFDGTGEVNLNQCKFKLFEFELQRMYSI